MSTPIEKLRKSLFHMELGQKMCAAFVAQQQGITVSSALKKVPDRVGDVWLIVADFSLQAFNESIDSQFGHKNVQTTELMH